MRTPAAAHNPHPHLPVSGNFAEQSAPSQASGGAGPIADTSHSVSISGPRFSMDFTWRRTENQTPALGPARDPSGDQRQPGPARRARTSFPEALKRQQLALLLAEPQKPPPVQEVIPISSIEAQPAPGPVLRSYAGCGSSLGPLGAGRHFIA